MKTPKTPVSVTPYEGQLTIQLTPVTMYEPEGLLETFLSPDAAHTWSTKVAPALCPDKEHVYLLMSSIVDVWRPWMSSYRAAQVKSNASLPGESPHFFGFSFDLDMTNTRAKLTQVSKRMKLGLCDNIEVKVAELLGQAAPSKWVYGMSVSNLHLREMLNKLGFTPHKNTKTELWHFNVASTGDSSALVARTTRYKLRGTIVDCQRALSSVCDPQTGKPYYEGKADGSWGPKSKAAWNAFYGDYKAAFIRLKGSVERARMLTGLPPGERGQTILRTFTAKFDLVPAREKF